MPGYRKLGRTSAHRKAMLRNLVTDLLREGRITTTDTRAKEARRQAATQAVAAAGRKMEEKERPPAPKEAIETVQDSVYVLDFRVHATEKQLDDLKYFLRSNGIRFEPVPKQ